MSKFDARHYPKTIRTIEYILIQQKKHNWTIHQLAKEIVKILVESDLYE